MFRPWLQTIDQNKRILEIGPLTTPMVPKIPGMDNVYYADIRSTEEVKEFYENAIGVDVNAIVPVDYVIKNSYSKDLKDVEHFDYIIMSHVLEHIPQLIVFFQDITNILKPDGKLCLVIPDKRYCFDHYRQLTSFAECYDIYKRGIPNNPLRFLDYNCSFTVNDPVFWWKNPTSYEHIAIARNYSQNLKQYEMVLSGGGGGNAYVHYNVFTPESFLLLVFYLTKCALFPFRILEFYGTEENTFEFNVVLEKHAALLDNTEENNKALNRILTLLSDNSDGKIQMTYIELSKRLQEENTQLHRDIDEMQTAYNELKETTNTQMESLLEEKMQLHQRLDAFLASRSWRITKPLRFLSSVVRKVIPS